MQVTSSAAHTSSMFLGEITVVDHAYIDKYGKVIGGSFLPSFLVTGEVDPVESVVEDFSSIKKRMKALIDDKIIGFDHKLWIIKGFSGTSFHIESSTKPLPARVNRFDMQADELYDLGYDMVFIETHLGTVLRLPLNAVKLVVPSDPADCEYTTDNAGKWFAEFLTAQFQHKFELECNNTMDPVLPLGLNKPHAMFSYVHGLKSSTSWGCQNIAHGHMSFIQLDCAASNVEAQRLLLEMTRDLDETVFIFEENLHGDEVIHYATERGAFTGDFKQKSIVLPTETTIEFLVEFADQNYGKRLAEAGVTKIFISEGLSKGAFIDLAKRYGMTGEVISLPRKSAVA